MLDAAILLIAIKVIRASSSAYRMIIGEKRKINR